MVRHTYCIDAIMYNIRHSGLYLLEVFSEPAVLSAWPKWWQIFILWDQVGLIFQKSKLTWSQSWWVHFYKFISFFKKMDNIAVQSMDFRVREIWILNDTCWCWSWTQDSLFEPQFPYASDMLSLSDGCGWRDNVFETLCLLLYYD